MELVVRHRAESALAARHQLRVIVIEAPAGFGRSTLLQQAVEIGPRDPRDRDALIACGGPVTTADEFAQALASARHDRDPAAHLAYLLDDVDRLDPDATGLLVEVIARLADRDHVVLTGCRLPAIGLPGLLAAGRAVHLGVGELALDADSIRSSPGATAHVELDEEVLSWPLGWGLCAIGRRDLIPETLEEIAARDLDPHARPALAALAAVGGGDQALTAAVLDAVEAVSGSTNVGVLNAVARLPLVDVVDDGCWPHGAWIEATRDDLDPAVATAAFGAAADAHRIAARFDQAGALAIDCGVDAVLARVVTDALDSQPPRVSMSLLEVWAYSGVLAADSAEQLWLEAVIAVHGRGSSDEARTKFEAARSAFEARGDADSETAVMFHLGSLARREDDLGLLGQLLARSRNLEPTPRIVGLLALGEAITAQLRGDSAAAVAILDAAPSGALVGDWACQHQMVLGTNLALAGRTSEAVLALSAATGTGSRWVRSVAHDLLGSVRWTRGDVDGAIEDARLAETLADEAGARTGLEVIRATKRCYLAYAGDAADDQASLAPRRRPDSDEAARLDALATIVGLLNAGLRDEARARLAELPAGPNRVVRSTLYRVPIEIALLPERRADWDELAGRVPALESAVAAGHAAVAHLEHGRVVDERFRPFLPSIWCDAAGSRVAVRLLGASSVSIDGRVLDHATWNRGRVRELCLHLAVVEGAGRERVAESLWPNLGDTAAAQNLRVTLTYLLDVLDPGRPRGRGSDLVVDGAGELRLALGPRLRVDIVTLIESASSVIAAGAEGDQLATLSAARRLLGAGRGPVLGGAPVGEWFDTVRRRIDDLVLRTIAIGGRVASEVGDHELAYQLGCRGLETEPWSERSHELVVGARIATGDLDGARRSLQTAIAELRAFGVEPSRVLIEYMWRAGLRPAVQLTPR